MISKKSIAVSVMLLMVLSSLFATSNASGFTGGILAGDIDESLEDIDGDGKWNYLVVTVPVDVVDVGTFEGDFRLSGALWDPSHSTMITSAEAYLDIEYSTTGVVSGDLKFAGRDINSSGFDGNYEVDIDLVYWDSLGYTWVIVESTTYVTTNSYDHLDFENTDYFQIMDIGWCTSDDDTDGLIDRIIVNVTVDVYDNDTATILSTISIFSADTVATEKSDPFDVTVGNDQNFSVDFDGRILNGLGRMNTQYEVFIEMETSDEYQDWDGMAIDYFNATDFEEYDRLVVTSPITVEHMDSDDDGLVDFIWMEFNVTPIATDRFAIVADVRNSTGDVIVSTAYSWEGYLISEYEQTIILFIPTYDIYLTGDNGSYTIETYDSYVGHWDGYVYIIDIPLVNASVDDLQLSEMNHPIKTYISGYVVDESGSPVSGATISAGMLEWPNYDSDTSGVDGAYNLSMAKGTLMATAECTGYVTKSMMIELDGNVSDYNITMVSKDPLDADITINVTNTTGSPVENANVMITRVGDGIYHYDYTDASGQVSLPVRNGTYYIFSRLVDYDNGTLDMNYNWITVEEGESGELNLTLSMRREGLFSSSGALVFEEEMFLSDWNSMEIRMSIEFPEYALAMLLELRMMADMYGDSDGYLEFNEIETLLLILKYWVFEGMMAEGMYSMGMFTVDGIGYYAPPESIWIGLPKKPIGPVPELGDSFAVDFTASGETYWAVANAESHEVYLQAIYDTDIACEDYFISAPVGYTLNDTNDPINVVVAGINPVSVYPGESPDEEEEYDTLAILSFVAGGEEPTHGAIEGIAHLHGETEHSGITVQLYDAEGDTPTPVKSATTGPPGKYWFVGLEPGHYLIVASMGGYYDGYANVIVDAGAITYADTIVLVPTSSDQGTSNLTMTVVTQAILPIANATIEVYYPMDNSTAMLSASTDENGRLSVQDLEPGLYRLVVTASGFDNLSLIVGINVGEDADITVILTSPNPVGYITGILRDEDGNPLEGILVEVRTAGSEDVIAEGTTDETGKFLIVGFADGDYNLTFKLNGKIIGWANVTVKDFVGNAGVIVIPNAMLAQDLTIWIIAIAAAVIAALIVAIALMRRKPKVPTHLQELEKIPAEEVEGEKVAPMEEEQTPPPPPPPPTDE